MGRRSLKQIIKEVVDNYVEDMTNNSVEVGGVNLEIQSPLEDITD